MRQFIAHAANLLRPLLFLMLFITILLQFSFVVHSISSSSADRDIVFAFDNDGAAAIATTQKTTWTNSNEWFAYGPLYYRIAKTLFDLEIASSKNPIATSPADSAVIEHYRSETKELTSCHLLQRPNLGQVHLARPSRYIVGIFDSTWCPVPD